MEPPAAPSPSSPSETAAAPVGAPVRRRGVLRILVFFAVVTGVLFGLDALVNLGLRRISTSKYGSLNRVLAGRVNAEILVAGSSRAAFHYDPRVLREITGRSAYNIGMVGARIDIQFGLLKAYLKHNAPPKRVILNLETSTFTMTEQGRINDPGLFGPYLHEEDIYRPLVDAHRVVWKWKHLPLYTYVVEDLRFAWTRGLLGLVGINGPEDLQDGYYPNFERWGADFFSFRAYGPGGVIYPVDPRAVETLSQLMQLCRDRGIPLVLVLSPEYHEAQATVRNRPAILAEFSRLCTQFDVPFWDYSASPLSRDRENFYSSQHLNADGATLFSADVARRLKTLFASKP